MIIRLFGRRGFTLARIASLDVKQIPSRDTHFPSYGSLPPNQTYTHVRKCQVDMNTIKLRDSSQIQAKAILTSYVHTPTNYKYVRKCETFEHFKRHLFTSVYIYQQSNGSHKALMKIPFCEMKAKQPNT